MNHLDDIPTLTPVTRKTVKLNPAVWGEQPRQSHVLKAIGDRVVPGGESWVCSCGRVLFDVEEALLHLNEESGQ